MTSRRMTATIIPVLIFIFFLPVSALPVHAGQDEAGTPAAVFQEYRYETPGKTITLTKRLRLENIARDFVPGVPDVTFTYDIAYDANTGDNREALQVNPAGYVNDTYEDRYTAVGSGVDADGTLFDIWRGPFGGISVSDVTFCHTDKPDGGSGNVVTKQLEVKINGGDGESGVLFLRPGVYRYPIAETGLSGVKEDITFQRTLSITDYTPVVTTDMREKNDPLATEDFTVRVWKENADDNGYTLAEQMLMSKNPKEEYNTVLKKIFVKDRYPGFHLNGTGVRPTDVNYKDDRDAFIIGKEDSKTVANVYYSRNTYIIVFRFDPEITFLGATDVTDGITGGMKLADGISRPSGNHNAYNLWDTMAYVKYGQSLYQGVYNGPMKGASNLRAFMDAHGEGWTFYATWLQESPHADTCPVLFNAENPEYAFDPGSREDGSKVLCMVKTKDAPVEIPVTASEDGKQMELRYLDVYVEWNDDEDGFVITDVVLHDIADDLKYALHGGYSVTGDTQENAAAVHGKQSGFSECVYTTYDLVIGKEVMGKGLTNYDINGREYLFDVKLNAPAYFEAGVVWKLQDGIYADDGRLFAEEDGSLHLQVDVKHGEYAILSGLPSGTTYTVREVNNEKDVAAGEPDTLDVFGANIYHTTELPDIIVTAEGDAGLLAAQPERNVRMMEMFSGQEAALMQLNPTELHTIVKKTEEESANHVFFLNVRGDVVVTGVNRNTQVYVVIVLVAFALFGLYIGSHYLRRKDE